MSVRDFLTLIESYFSYVFEDCGFKVVYVRTIRPYHHLIGFESNVFRLLFVQELDSIGIFVGTLESSFDDFRDQDKRTREWVNIYNLLAYLGRELDWSALENIPYLERTNFILSVTVREFALLSNQIAQMFCSLDAVSQWKPAYDRWLKASIQQRYSI